MSDFETATIELTTVQKRQLVLAMLRKFEPASMSILHNSMAASEEEFAMALYHTILNEAVCEALTEHVQNAEDLRKYIESIST